MSFNRKNLNHISPEEKNVLSKKMFIFKNTVFISNIPKEIFSKEILYQKKFLGQYGHINQLFLINNNKIENSLIVQFDTINQAALCIISLENFEMGEKKHLKANYYNTKFCHFFLNNKECKNSNCLLIHSLKINNYLYKEFQEGDYINSFQFALNILEVSLNSFKLISDKFIGEKFFEKKGKFPKMTMKKLKREELIKNLSDQNEKNNQKSIIKNFSLNDIKIYENYLKTLDDINKKKYLNDMRSISNKRLIDKQLNKSRFFVEEKKENENYKVNIPESVFQSIDKIIEIYMKNKINNNNSKNIIINDVNIDNFNINWSELMSNILYGINHKN